MVISHRLYRIRWLAKSSIWGLYSKRIKTCHKLIVLPYLELPIFKVLNILWKSGINLIYLFNILLDFIKLTVKKLFVFFQGCTSFEISLNQFCYFFKRKLLFVLICIYFVSVFVMYYNKDIWVIFSHYLLSFSK